MIDQRLYRISEVADVAGVSPTTLRRWLREGKIQEPGRDRNDWRVWTQVEVDRVVHLARTYRGPAQQQELRYDGYETGVEQRRSAGSPS